jgi:hypothetical protein
MGFAGHFFLAMNGPTCYRGQEVSREIALWQEYFLPLMPFGKLSGGGG